MHHVYFPTNILAIDCGEAPEVPNTSKNGNGTTYGSAVTYTCNRGYEVGSGSNTSICDASKEWLPHNLTCVGKKSYMYNVFNLIHIFFK